MGFCYWCGSSSLKPLLLMVVPLVMVMALTFAFLNGPSSNNNNTLVPLLWSSITPSSSPNNSSSLFINNGDDNKTMHAFDDHHMFFFNNLSYFSPPPLSLPEQYNQTEVVDHDISKTWASSAPLNESYVVPQNMLIFFSFFVFPFWEQNQTEVVDHDISKTWASSAPLNESYVVPQRKFSILDRTEAGLLQARAAIRDARNWNQTLDQDYVPIGPVYRNAKAFHRSYLEMEKQFKVFVYKEGEPPIFHNGPCKSIYSMEGNFIHAIEMNEQFRTRDPKKAHVFFLPFSVVMMVRFVYERNSRDFGPIRTTVKDYINLIAGRYPYWNRSLGSDHFMLSCHDWGPETSFSIPYLYKNSIRVLCNANTSEGFNPTKDVSLPEVNLQTGTIDGFLGGPSASKRSILAFFAGGVHGPIRPIILEQWENKDEDIQVHKYLPKGVSYYGMLRKSKFCLCPSGYEVASPRVVEAIYTGCVPVLISDHYVPPFSDVLNWKSFSVEVSSRDIPKLKEILTNISSRQYIRMQRRVDNIRRHFEVHYPPKRFDVFHMILHSVWLRRLNIRIYDD
ncbi:probable glycosyltransferase At5g03795 [Arachis ipaensis]|uniref:probable glycosyltransferase At5g03795 n=1 Tax=Arachis ipaensis TaxID=130454 RepID=UPI000A2B1BA7|nr:probable glycosyltransferase At5g03795 [Arachis ipaensis]